MVLIHVSVTHRDEDLDSNREKLAWWFACNPGGSHNISETGNANFSNTPPPYKGVQFPFYSPITGHSLTCIRLWNFQARNVTCLKM
jgi:hypothetical protein